MSSPSGAVSTLIGLFKFTGPALYTRCESGPACGLASVNLDDVREIVGRDIVVRVIERECSVSELARRYAMSFAAVQKHVAVLERAHLVVKTRRGREVLVGPDVATIARGSRLLRGYEDLWRGRVARMDALLDPSTDHD